jgi:cytochrome c553
MLRLSILCLALTVAAMLPIRAAEPAGEQMYQAVCAHCHGAHGEGTKRHNKPLEGDRSVAQLAELIRTTMPQNDVGLLSLKDAQVIAEYVSNAFYSPVARERNRPARIDLSRLTIRQYRNAVSDLVGSFRWQPSWGDQRGLKGEYFAAREFRKDKRALERTDAQVHFDFKNESPAAGKIEPHEFSIRWTGSFLAPETGEYEFAVRTDHAAQLWINDNNRPLIDAWVKSGTDTEYKNSVFLVAGRIYPLRLEFTKAKQGVDDSKKQKEKPPPGKAFVALLWKRPLGTLELIPARQLSTNSAPESYICSTPFPPDDRSYGWERGTTVSMEWEQAETDAALETAAYVMRHLGELAGVKYDAADRPQKLRAFCRTFAERAFRRPLTPDETKLLLDKQFDATKDADVAVKRSLLLALMSPRFLYREVGATPSAYDTVCRLSFGLWDSLPDPEMAKAAAAGQLATKEQIIGQAVRLLADPKAKAKLRDFLLRWVKADQPRDLGKDDKKFPGFDAATIADLRTSLELLLDDVVWSNKSDFRELFLSEEIFLNGRLAKFYGVNLPVDADFTKAKLDAGKRAGVLTHPYLMASFAHSSDSSPIHRGVFLARGVLGVSLRPPPEAVTPLSPDLHPSLTTRERVVLQTKATNCLTCHGVINPLGFTLEHFDAVGRYREKDHESLVDSTGSYQTRSGQIVTLRNARELANFLAGSEEVQDAFIEQLFHHLVQQPVRAYGPNTLADLRKSFAANGFNIRKLVVEILATTAMKGRGHE